MFGRKKLKKTLKIEGMHCEHCAKKTENTLKEIDGVKNAKVNLNKKEAIVELEKDISNDIFEKAIEEIDFKVTDIS